MEYVFLGIDSLLVTLFYYLHKKCDKELLNLINAPQINVNNLANETNFDKPIEYAMIVGKVAPNDSDLVSHYHSYYRGVIRIIEIRELGTSWKNNVTVETNKLLSKVTNDVKFSLICQNQSTKQSLKLNVSDVFQTEYLLDNLTTTHKNFDPIKKNTFTDVVKSLISKQASKGIETTEYMLTNDTKLTAFGRIEKMPLNESIWFPSNSKIAEFRLCKPTGDYKYILTPLSRDELIDKVKSTKRTFKVCLYIFGSVAIGLGAYCAFKFISEFIDKRKREKQLAEARQQRLRNQRARARFYDDELIANSVVPRDITVENTENNSPMTTRSDRKPSEESNSCVVCLTNPRELVLLDCGHVCLCMDCFEMMPSKNCPICRQPYRSFVPCYIP